MLRVFGNITLLTGISFITFIFHYLSVTTAIVEIFSLDKVTKMSEKMCHSFKCVRIYYIYLQYPREWLDWWKPAGTQFCLSWIFVHPSAIPLYELGIEFQVLPASLLSQRCWRNIIFGPHHQRYKPWSQRDIEGKRKLDRDRDIKQATVNPSRHINIGEGEKWIRKRETVPCAPQSMRTALPCPPPLPPIPIQ